MHMKRLFDCLDHQLAHFPKQDMLAAKEKGVWTPYSTANVAATVNKLSAGLLSLGISGKDFTPEGSDKIAIMSSNRPEWVFTDLACQQIGAILVPLYPTTNPIEVEFILNDAAVGYIFVSNLELYEKVKSVASKVPSIKGVFTFDTIEGATHWSDLTAKATPALLDEVAQIKKSIPVTQLATIIYTSGTTGVPKGVMLSHQNIYSNVMFSKESFPFEDAPDSKVLSFLPLNHIFEKMVTYIYLYSGISIYYAESLETIGDNLKEIKPDGFTTVPRLLEKVFEKIMAKGAEQTGIKKKLFFWAVALGEKYDNIQSGGFWYNLQLAIANKLIFTKWREALGGNVSFIVTGGAACQVKLLRIFNAAKIPVFEGYGPTENSPVISVNRKIKGGTKFGTVGPVINGIQVKIEADGEICVAGESVMVGYYKRPDLTAEAVINGWLHTGDIGVFENDIFLKITDRKKEIFKTSGGKYIVPQAMENRLKQSRFIEQAMVIGEGEKFPAVFIVPNFAFVKEWALRHNLDFSQLSNDEIIANQSLIDRINEEISEINLEYGSWEQLKKVKLLPQEFTIEGGELTPTLKFKRKKILEKYQAQYQAIYSA